MKPIRTAILTASYACLAFLHVSCVREDTGDCMQYEIHVRVVDAAGNDLTQSGVLEKSEVYLFGENGFVRMVPAGVSSDYLFGNHKEARLTLVAWGNIKEDTLITAKIKPGILLEEARLKLKQHANRIQQHEHYFAIVGQCARLPIVASQQGKDDYRTGYNA